MDEEHFDFSGAETPVGLLESLDRIIASLPPGDQLRRELLDLRISVAEHQDMMDEARQAIE